VRAAWDCLAPGGTLVAVVSQGWERPAKETELLLFRRWFATVQARQKELPEDTVLESAPPMQSRLIWAVKRNSYPMSLTRVIVRRERNPTLAPCRREITALRLSRRLRSQLAARLHSIRSVHQIPRGTRLRPCGSRSRFRGKLREHR
jgi:hypothetical protein